MLTSSSTNPGPEFRDEKVSEAPRDRNNEQSEPLLHPKKKPRLSRAQKRARKVFRDDGNNASTNQEKKLASFQDRIRSCVSRISHTGSIMPHLEGAKEREMRVVTCCSLEESKILFPPDAAKCTYRVQPLIILDLNGILCHRSRPGKEINGVRLRKSFDFFAASHIIPRQDLVPLLQWLDRNFCLAIWTSAKRKTTKKLISLLLPPTIHRRLLFVWSQSECSVAVDASSSTCTNDADTGYSCTYEKRLSKVWKAFPLWSANNTLLVDDSPAKCPEARANALHPPSIHGQFSERPANSSAGSKSSSFETMMSDEANEELQRQFFGKYIQFWTSHAYNEPVAVQEEPDSLNMTNPELRRFLNNNGAGHMGWRNGSF